VSTGAAKTSKTGANPAGGIWAPARRPLTVGLVLAVTFVAFEALAVATILPVVGRELGDLRLYGWVFSAFLLASLIGIVVAGTLADRLPLGQPMLAGLALFVVGLVIGGTAPDMLVLVAGRAVQGLGAGVVPAVAYVAISRCYPDDSRPRMFAVLSTAWVVPGLIGPGIAALVAAAAGWRWVFLGLIPLVAAAGALVVVALRNVPPPDSPSRVPVPYLAVLGVVAGAGTALASLNSGLVAVAVAGGIGGAVLLAASLRYLTPPRNLSARPGLTATILSRGLLTCCFFAGDAYVPYAIVTVRHAPTALAALALTGSTLTWTAGSWVQARWIARVGPRRLVRAGECLVAAGLLLMGAVILTPVPPALAIAAWAVAGGGIGTAYAPLSVTTLDRAAAGEEGRATSALQLCDVLGQAIGTGVAGAIVAAAASRGHGTAVALAFSFAVAVAVVAIAAGRRLPGRLAAPGPEPETPPPAEPVTGTVARKVTLPRTIAESGGAGTSSEQTGRTTDAQGGRDEPAQDRHPRGVAGRPHGAAGEGEGTDPAA
jgi:MFS family permease